MSCHAAEGRVPQDLDPSQPGSSQGLRPRTVRTGAQAEHRFLAWSCVAQLRGLICSSVRRRALFLRTQGRLRGPL